MRDFFVWFSGIVYEFGTALRKHIFKLLVAAVFAFAYFVAEPRLKEVKIWWADVNNINTDDALGIARKSIGSNSQFAVPFRNLGSSDQYIATWVSFDPTRSDHCITGHEIDIDDQGIDTGSCPWGGGPAQAIMMVGQGEVFEEVETMNYAFNIAASQFVDDRAPYIEGETLLVEEQLKPDELQIYFGVTDWNRDGIKEILSITSDGSPSTAVNTYRISLFDSGSRISTQLLVIDDGIKLEQFLIPAEAEPTLRAWLFDRFEGFVLNYAANSCERAISGVLNCMFKKDENSFVLSRTDQGIFQLVSDAQEAWLHSNGSTFTTGFIELEFLPGIVKRTEANGYCELSGENLSIVNAFKGPVLVVDHANSRTSVLYAPAGPHLREIPNIVVGRDFIWLSALVGKNLIAINKRTFESVLVSVDEWKDGELVPIFQHENHQSPDGAKERMIPEITLTNGVLSHRDQELSLRVNGMLLDSAVEFENAKQCNEHF